MSEFATRDQDRERDEQASLWAARLEGTQLTGAQRRELQAWLEAHPSHRQKLAEYCQFSEVLEPWLEQALADRRIEWPEMAQRRASRTWFWGRWAVASMAGGLAAWWLLAGQPAGWEAEKWATPVAQRQIVTLADKSVVELNAGTQLVVEEGSSERRLRLVTGEAFFSVVKDPSRPFVVETPLGSVQVTGTRFNVLAEGGNGVQVTVESGSVRVSPGAVITAESAPQTLQPGEQWRASIKAVEHRRLSVSELEAALGWRSGVAIFDHTPLDQALKPWARFHGRTLVAEAAVAELAVGGRFPLDDLDGFLNALETILPVRVTRDLNGTVRIVRRDTTQ